jgi:ferredoxin
MDWANSQKADFRSMGISRFSRSGPDAWKLPASVFVLVFILLSAVQFFVEMPMLILERFMEGGGWIEILIVSLYGAFLAHKMRDPDRAPRWRSISWTLFSVVFFSQLLLGLMGFDRFLMTGDLHLPVPAMILAGPVYRWEVSFMTLLFISTVVLTGPAWCSHLCYFGAIDHQLAGQSRKKKRYTDKRSLRYTLLFVFIAAALSMRIAGVEARMATLAGIMAGVIGLLVMFFFSTRQKQMVHCTRFCPVGTLVMHLKKINPFRMDISSECTACLACVPHCRHGALNARAIERGKPDDSCTYCGDCLAGCHRGSIRYNFPGLNSRNARNLYLVLTISLHAVFMALGRI